MTAPAPAPSGPPPADPAASPSGPPPARVRGNDWPSLPVPPADGWTPHRPVTVVVPYYQAPEALALTLAALEGQTYPRDLFEVVVADDGSNPPLDPARPPVSDTPLAVRVVHQPDRGFGLARARNTGARAAAGEILVFLDCDMMPEAGWLAAHARWHHAVCDAVSIGFRAHVEPGDLSPEAVRSRPGSLADLFEGRPAERPEWIEFHMVRTSDLTSYADDLFRVAAGGNFGISRPFFELVGGFDETFTQWGAEDIEFGFRAFTRAGVLVPVPDAFCWHQGPGAAPSPEERFSLDLQHAKIAHLIAHRGFRRDKPGRSFTVPQYVVSVGPGSLEAVSGAVEAVLGCGIADLMVWVTDPADGDGAARSPGPAGGDGAARSLRDADGDGAARSPGPAGGEGAAAADGPAVLTDDEREWLRRQFDPDPRVRFGPPGGALDAFPHAAFHMAVPAEIPVNPYLIRRLRWVLGSADLAVSVLGDGAEVSIARTRVLHRARRSGLAVAEVGRVKEVPPAGLELAPGPRSVLVWLLNRRLLRFLPGRVRYWAAGVKFVSGPADPEVRRLVKAAQKLSQIRRPDDLRLFLRWLGFAAAWRINRRRRTLMPRWLGRRPRPAPVSAEGAVTGPAPASAGAVTGPVSAEGAATGPALASAAAVTGPGPAGSSPEAPPAKGRSRLSVPAFDLTAVNPIGWAPDFDDVVVALGPPELLPPGAADGAAALKRRRPSDRPADLRRARYVIDVAAYHANPLERAAALAELAAAGVVVRLADAAPAPSAPAPATAPSASGAAPSDAAPAPSDAAPATAAPGPGLRECLGPELHDLMAAPGPGPGPADARRRELISIRMRRAALRDHSRQARPPASAAPTGPVAVFRDLSWPPEVSVLLPTRRPEMLASALAGVARQTYPRLELVLAPHGDGFDPARMAEATAGLAFPVRVVPAPAEAPLGQVLDQAAAAASGKLLTKFDDDDLYGAEHVWDLVLARLYSRAELVAKGAEYVYLAASDVTLRRFGGKGERFSRRPTIAGGTMLMAASDLAAAGGWRPLPAGVDAALIEDVDRIGGRIYRTHGAGYVLVRHGAGHTWPADDGYFLAQAELVQPGRCPALADVDA